MCREKHFLLINSYTHIQVCNYVAYTSRQMYIQMYSLIQAWPKARLTRMIVICPRVTLCGWRDVKIQELYRGRGPSECGLWTWQTLGEQPVLWTLQTLNLEYRRRMTHWLNSTHPERYRHWTLCWDCTLQTLNTMLRLYTTDTEHYGLWTPWTLPTLNNGAEWCEMVAWNCGVVWNARVWFVVVVVWLRGMELCVTFRAFCSFCIM